jgi:hypothetical protein
MTDALPYIDEPTQCAITPPALPPQPIRRLQQVALGDLRDGCTGFGSKPNGVQNDGIDLAVARRSRQPMTA